MASASSNSASSGGQFGFWSYTHRDNDLVDGAIAQLATKVENAYELISGQKLPLFHDRSSLEWGHRWRERIDSALGQTTFFIPIVTPLYFTSDECRRELLEFAGVAEALGRPALILPIYYAPVEDFSLESADNAKKLVASMQYEDWTAARLLDMTGQEHRQKVNGVARRLLEIVNSDSLADDEPSGPIGRPGLVHAASVGDDEPGYFDVLAQDGGVLDEISEVLNAFTAKQAEITDEVGRWSPKMSEAGAIGPKAMAEVARLTAEAIRDDTRELELIGEQVSAALQAADPSVRVALEMAGGFLGTEEATRETSIEMLRSIVELRRGSIESQVQADDLTATLDETAKLSRHLRQPLGMMKNGYRNVSDGRVFINAWGEEAARLLSDVFEVSATEDASA